MRNANTGNYDLASVSTAYGCTEPYFLIRQAFQRRTAMNRYDEFRRPGMFSLDMNFAKTTPITKGVRLQIRLEAFNLLNTPQYDERQYNQDTNSADFGRINRNSTGQSGFQRFIQMGFRVMFRVIVAGNAASVAFPVLNGSRLRAQGSGKTFEHLLEDLA